MGVAVEALLLGIIWDADAAANNSCHLQAQQGCNGGVDGSGHGCGDLYRGLCQHWDGVEAAEDGRGSNPKEAGAEEATNAVNTKHVEGVVILDPLLDVDGEEAAHNTGTDAEEDSSDWPHKAGTRSDGRQAGDGARGNAQHAGLAVHHNVLQRPHRSGRGSCKLRGKAGKRGVGGGSEGRTSVESIPANPEHPGSEDGKKEVPGDHAVVLTWAKDSAAHQGSDAGCDVHNNATGKVENAVGSHEAVWPPHHVAGREVHSKHPQDTVPHHGAELHALHKAANHQSGRDDGKGHLVQCPQSLRDGLPQAGLGNAGQERLVQAADDRVAHLTEAEGVADSKPEHRDDAG
mmetsp:Transcript_28585/g.80574  ORF Transcript_28585/g.80574 Transcript_28585/m.80574 type:complete len:346 (-) Transcript_28585:634-1671(-)